MEHKISIPKPCHENWDEMLPEQQGRHCLACSKTVIDFTGWEMEEIQDYLQGRSAERFCGRFNNDQVSPAATDEQLLLHIAKARIPVLRKIAAVIILCFGLLNTGDANAQKKMGKVACPKPQHTEQVKGEVAIQQPDTTKQQPAKADTIITRPQPQIMGMIAPNKPKKAPVVKPVRKRK